MPHAAQAPKPIRSGVAMLLLYMGIGLFVIGVLMGIAGVAGALLTGDTSMFAGLILTLVFGGAGALMHLAGRRTYVLVEAEGMRWSSPFVSEQRIAWRDVHHVELPLSGWQGRTAILHLQDGSQRPLSAIRMSSGNHGAWADAGYTAAGEQVIAAHQWWLANLR